MKLHGLEASLFQFAVNRGGDYYITKYGVFRVDSEEGRDLETRFDEFMSYNHTVHRKQNLRALAERVEWLSSDEASLPLPIRQYIGQYVIDRMEKNQGSEAEAVRKNYERVTGKINENAPDSFAAFAAALSSQLSQIAQDDYDRANRNAYYAKLRECTANFAPGDCSAEFRRRNPKA